MEHRGRTSTRLICLLVFAGLFLLTSCEKYVWEKEEVPEELVVSFSANIYPFCHGCHTAWTSERAYDNLSANVSVDNPESSRVLSIHSSITAFGSQMIDIDGVLVSSTDMIKKWASDGAANN